MTTDFEADNYTFDDPYISDDSPDADLPELEIPEEEPLLTALLKSAIARYWAGDAVMNDFAEHVLPFLVNVLRLMSAKGGEFAAAKAEAGRDISGYQRDQSLRAHLLNGLLATMRILQLAIEAKNRQALLLGDYERRLLVAGYLLHDYLKMLEDEALHATIQNPSAAMMPTIYQTLEDYSDQLNLHAFFAAGGDNLRLDDLLYVVHNTQVRWGTTPSRLLAQDVSDPRKIGKVAHFSRIADLLAYGTFLETSTLKRINDILTEALDERPFDLTAHRLTQMTGMLSAYVNNAVIEAMEYHGHIPILFAPNGVIYASPRAATLPDLETIASQSMKAIHQATMNGIERHVRTPEAVGFEWGTQGLKAAPYINDLFQPVQILHLAWQLLNRRLLDTRTFRLEQLKTYKRLDKGTELGWFDSDYLPAVQDYIDRRAEALGDWLAFAYTLNSPIGEQAVDTILVALGFDVEAIHPLMDMAQKGGVQYWSAWVAAEYIRHHPALSPDEIDAQIRQVVFPALEEILAGHTAPQELIASVYDFVMETVYLPNQPPKTATRFYDQFEKYRLNKTDLQAGLYDTIYNWPRQVQKQQEATLPYMPTPYSQRIPLGKGDALSAWRRGISGIGVINMLLMQLALRQPFKFEERKGKMLFIYPAYYFTVETGEVVLNIINRLRSFNIYDWLFHTEHGLSVNTDRVANYHELLEKPKMWSSVQTMRYPVAHAPSYVQVAVDPGLDKTEVESWLNTVLIALILTSVLDVKVVASESPAPLFQSGVGFDETVWLDAPHSAYADLIGRTINIDDVLPMLQRLTMMLAVWHDSYGYDFKKLNALADIGRRLAADPANVFMYYQRESDPTPAFARRYLYYAERLEQTARAYQRSETVNHARELVARYRQFYRSKNYTTNAILRPIQAAADAILKADSAHSDLTMLADIVLGRLIQIETAMDADKTQGYFPRGIARNERRAAMRDFAEYFVYRYYHEALKDRKSLLRGTQFNLLRLACDAVYRDLQSIEKADNSVEAEESESEE
ncbi:MAG: type I-D CRISPR-associated protein Cas10d/Csc3 [Chloroflexi bacterium]|nr:type I-D CRISPR-associated protein Cas10d/Csc3 [Chloroflexota bacterium]